MRPLTRIAESIVELQEALDLLHDAAERLDKTSSALAQVLTDISESLAIGGSREPS